MEGSFPCLHIHKASYGRSRMADEHSFPCLHVHTYRLMAGAHGPTFFIRRSNQTPHTRRYGLLEHNVAAMGLQANVHTHQGDFLRLLPQLQQDVVFLDPPWVCV